MDNYDTEGSITYGLRAENILEIMEDMARNEEEVKEVESLANEMIKSFEDYTQEDLKKHEDDKESAAYRMMNANLIELEDIKSRFKNTPECY